MKFLKFTRYNEWWEYKLVPLLTIGYAVIYLNNFPFNIAIIRLLVLLLAIITGAIYVSVINDVTDIKEDAIAGKKNRMANLSPLQRIMIVGLSLLIGIYFGYLIYPDKLSLFFYIMAYLVFTLYSVPPVRLKKRWIWGLLCDASGAHFFPTLLIVFNLSFTFEQKPNIAWAIAIGIWALACGLRGILWHQFYDRDNDLASGTTTFASRINPDNFKIWELALFGIELCAFGFLLSCIFNWLIFVSLVLYFLLVLIRKYFFGYHTTIIISPKTAPYHVLMNDFYLVFLPLSLLILISINNKYGWIALLMHLVLFPQIAFLTVKQYFIFFKKLIKFS